MGPWIALGIVGIAVLWAVFTFNRLVAYRNRAENGWSQIDVQLRRRYDLIPNLVETVKGYAAHEREVFEEVTEARAARDRTPRASPDQAAGRERDHRGLRQLLAVAENYPDLKANENFLALQEELTGTESKIAYARQYYNDQVMRLNTRIQSFPSSPGGETVPLHPARVLRHRGRRRERPVQVDLGGPSRRVRTDRGEQAQDACCSFVAGSCSWP